MWYNVWVAGEYALTIKKPQTASLIDTLSEGFAAINRRPWLVLLPLLLNLYIWFGTQLSFAPLLTDLSTTMRMNTAAAEQAGLPSQPVDLLRGLSLIDMRQELARLNFIPTLTMYRTVTADTDLENDPVAAVAGLLTMYRIMTADTNTRPIGFLFVQEMPQMIAAERGTAISVSNWGGIAAGAGADQRAGAAAERAVPDAGGRGRAWRPGRDGHLAAADLAGYAGDPRPDRDRDGGWAGAGPAVPMPDRHVAVLQPVRWGYLCRAS